MIALLLFLKRRSGVYKKASELATLCGAEVGVVVFSPSGKPFSYANSSIDSIPNRFLNGHRHHYQHQDYDHHGNGHDQNHDDKSGCPHCCRTLNRLVLLLVYLFLFSTNIDAIDRRSHTIVEAYRQARIDEMNKKHNKLESELEVERERGKTLQ